MNRIDLQANAYHEAGHAVLATLLGMKFEFIEIYNSVQDEFVLGRTRISENYLCSPHFDSLFDFWRMNVVCLAGGIAREKFDSCLKGLQPDMGLFVGTFRRFLLRQDRLEWSVNCLFSSLSIINDPVIWNIIEEVAETTYQNHRFDKVEMGKLIDKVKKSQASKASSLLFSVIQMKRNQEQSRSEIGLTPTLNFSDFYVQGTATHQAQKKTKVLPTQKILDKNYETRNIYWDINQVFEHDLWKLTNYSHILTYSSKFPKFLLGHENWTCEYQPDSTEAVARVSLPKCRKTMLPVLGKLSKNDIGVAESIQKSFM